MAARFATTSSPTTSSTETAASPSMAACIRSSSIISGRWRGRRTARPPAGNPRAIVNDHRRVAGGLSFLVAVLLVCGAVPGRAQSASVSLRSSHLSPVSGSVVLTADVPPDPELLAVQFKLDGYV